MTTTYYYSVNGQIQGQHVLGDAEGKDYLLDASGNLVGVYQGDYLKADAAYDPFGNILDSWNISFYNFTWAGGHGYRQTGLAYSSVYVRARHYSNLDAGWTTRDPLWPSEMPYGYVDGRVPGSVDPSGMQKAMQRNQPPKPGVDCTPEKRNDMSNQRAITYLQAGVNQGGVSVGVSAGGSVNISPFGIGGSASGGISGGYSSRIVCSEVAIVYEDFKCLCKMGPCADGRSPFDCAWVSVDKFECKGQYCVEKLQVGNATFVLWEHFKPYSGSNSKCKERGELIIDDQALKNACAKMGFSKKQCADLMRWYKGKGMPQPKSNGGGID